MIQLAEYCQQEGMCMGSLIGFLTLYVPVAMALYHSNVPFFFLKINSKSNCGALCRAFTCM